MSSSAPLYAMDQLPERITSPMNDGTRLRRPRKRAVRLIEAGTRARRFSPPHSVARDDAAPPTATWVFESLLPTVCRLKGRRTVDAAPQHEDRPKGSVQSGGGRRALVPLRAPDRSTS